MKQTTLNEKDKDFSTDLTKRKEWLLHMLYEHNGLAEEKVNWVTGLASVLSSLLLYNFGGIKYLVVLFRNITEREFYVKYLADMTRHMDANCYDLDFQNQEEKQRLNKLAKKMKALMKRHKYDITHMPSASQVIESFGRHFSLKRTPKALLGELAHYQARSQSLREKGYPYFEFLQRFYHNYQLRNQVLYVPPWSTFFPEQVSHALENYEEPLTPAKISLVVPSTWEQLIQQSASHLALMAASCQRKHFLPSPESDSYQISDFIHYFGIRSIMQLISEFFIAIGLMSLMVNLISNMIIKFRCARPSYLFVNLNELKTHRDVEKAICIVMHHMQNTATQSLSSQWAQWLFLIIPFVVLIDQDLLGTWYQVTMAALVILSLWEFKCVAQDTCGKNSFFYRNGKYNHLLSGLFDSLQQQATISGDHSNRTLDVAAKPYGSIPQRFMFISIQTALKAAGIPFSADNTNRSLSINNIQALDPCTIGYLCYLLAAKELDRCVKAQAIRSQLDRYSKRVTIEPVIETEKDNQANNGIKFAWQLSFQNIGLKDIPDKLDLPAIETHDSRQILVTTITVRNLLTPTQLKALKKLVNQQYQTPSSHTSGGGGVKTSKKKRAISKQEQVKLALPKLLVPEVIIEWPCGAHWISSKKNQPVVPVRSQLNMFFLVLCGNKEDFSQGIFHLFQVLVKNGPAIVPPEGASGVVQVPDTDTLHNDHGCKWKLKHLGAKQWRIGINTEKQLGAGSAQLLICNVLYRKNKPNSYRKLELPTFPALP